MKKKLVLPVLILIFTTTYSQNCKLVKNEKDDFTGKIVKVTDNINVAPYKMFKLKGRVMRDGDQTFFALFFTAGTGDFGCVSNDSYVSFKFENSEEVLSLKHLGDIDCSALPVLIINVTEHTESLQNSNILKIRLGYKSHIDIDLNDKQVFGKMLSCVQ
jgi:hypothetical protein